MMQYGATIPNGDSIPSQEYKEKSEYNEPGTPLSLHAVCVPADPNVTGIALRTLEGWVVGVEPPPKGYDVGDGFVFAPERVLRS